jgi:hypothetical protein
VLIKVHSIWGFYKKLKRASCVFVQKLHYGYLLTFAQDGVAFGFIFPAIEDEHDESGCEYEKNWVEKPATGSNSIIVSMKTAI